MMERMQRRWDVYKEAADALLEAAQRMQAITGAGRARRPGQAGRDAPPSFSSVPEEVADSVPWLHKTAEEVRTVAGRNEQTLYAYREAWIEAGASYLHVKGSRAWNSENGEDS